MKWKKKHFSFTETCLEPRIETNGPRERRNSLIDVLQQTANRTPSKPVKPLVMHINGFFIRSIYFWLVIMSFLFP